MKYITMTLALLSVGAEAVRLQFGFSLPSIDLSSVTEALPVEVPEINLDSLGDVAAAAGVEVPTDLNALTAAAGVELPAEVTALTGDITSLDDLSALATQATDLTTTAEALGTNALAGNLAGSELVDASLLLAGDTANLAGATDLAANLDASADLATLGVTTIQDGDLANGAALLSDTVTTALAGGDPLANLAANTTDQAAVDAAVTDAIVEQAVVEAAVE